MTIGERLREERERMALSQQALAEVCGTGKRQQIKYEGAEQLPGATYLAGAARAGIDVVYVLTGLRAGHLEPDEARLLAAYRSASAEMRRVMHAALGAADGAPPRGVARTEIKTGRVGQVINAPVTYKAPLNINMGGRSRGK